MIESGLRTRGIVKRGDGANPLVSVITVVRNGEAGIGKTIEAVLEQTYPNVEYLIIDGASTDGTLDIIRRFDDRIDYWMSAADNGLYDAMNKGIALVTDPEAYVMFANADDRLISATAIETLVNEGRRADFIYGKELLTDGEISSVMGSEVTFESLARLNICHAASLTKRRVFDALGRFDLRYRIVSDYDFFVRCFTSPATTRFVDQVVAEVRMFGLSETRYMLLLQERLDVLARRYRGIPRLSAAARIYCYDIPRHFLRGQLRRHGLLSSWRALKGMRND
jgi:glycosyltransferase involved in cell wall biosynthesis